MNRILQADVILTLTVQQAEQLLAALYTAQVRGGSKHFRQCAETVRRLVMLQMREQGVQV